MENDGIFEMLQQTADVKVKENQQVEGKKKTRNQNKMCKMSPEWKTKVSCGGEFPRLVSHFVSAMETSAFRMPLVLNIIN